MNAEAEAGSVRSEDCQTQQQSVATSLCEQLQHTHIDDGTSDKHLSSAAAAAADCDPSCTATTSQYCTCDSHRSAGLGSDDQVNYETNIVINAGESSRAEDNKRTRQHVQLETASDVHCDKDIESFSQTLMTLKCTAEYDDVGQFGDVTKDYEVDQCFTIPPDSPSRCSANSLQDAFIQFLHRKQVS